MTPDLRQLVSDAREVTGAQPPGLMRDDAPVLEASALSEQADDFYLVGLIGGKDVGKTSLVNALAQERIGEPSSHGRGTQCVTAYVHESRRQAVEQLLERETPGRFAIITHRIDRLAGQALLDLPDIDSQWEDHLEITRRMLRHMLFPVWIQSVEKYADERPRTLLMQVAAGNSPENFIFCLNKIDQVIKREGESAAIELRDDFARRIALALKLPVPPAVRMISAAHPDEHDLPALRELLSRQKSEPDVSDSRRRAMRQQGRTVLSWLGEQNLPEREAALERLEEQALEACAQRIAVPIIERGLTSLLDDPRYRLGMVGAVLERRMRRWPIVNWIDAPLSPLLGLWHRATAARSEPVEDFSALIAAHLKPGGEAAADLVQRTFAQLHQAHPILAPMYRQRRLWEPMAAEHAADDLRIRLCATLERQRAMIGERLNRRRLALLAAPLRWAMTIGALLWFPLIQPLLEAMLQRGYAATARDLVLLAVQLLGVNYLLRSAVFLLIYFVALWLGLRWHTHRRVRRLLERWRRGGSVDSSLSLEAQTLNWTHSLIEPIRAARGRIKLVISRMEALERSAA